MELIKGSEEILDENKKILIEFYHACVTQGLTLARIEKYFFHLYHLAKLIKKPFPFCEKEDIQKLVEVIESRDYSDWTKHDYKIILRKFFKWLRGSEDYPEEVKWIKVNSIKNNRLPEEILTEEEVKRLANFANNPRDRALVLTLYESGCRIGELLSLKIKNVSFDDYGAILIVSGKTGSRRVRIISSAPALASWIENHPFKNNPEAFLWVVLGTRNHHEMMSYASVCSLLKKLAKKAGIKKRVNPHSFRHARATHLASFLTEAQLCQHMGWVQGSDMASTYVHLSGRDVDNALLKLHGLAKDEKKEEGILKVKICPRCQEKNDPIARFCKRCASPLDIKTALDFEEKRKRKDEVVAKVIEALSEDPKIKERIYKVIKKLKLEKEFEEE
jgi:site-specific recombinase XerD/ribosomal protein L40E